MKDVPQKIAFLGETGSFSESAATTLFSENCSYIRTTSFDTIFTLVTSEAVDYGVVPIENSIAGAIHDNFDLLGKHNVFVVKEYVQPINLHLAGLTESLADIHNVYSHQKALEQCSRFFSSHPDLVKHATSDTATAAHLVHKKKDISCAAICSSQAAAAYGLKLMASSVQDSINNKTRFLAFSHQPPKLNDPVNKLLVVVAGTSLDAAVQSKLSAPFERYNLRLHRVEQRVNENIFLDWIGDFSIDDFENIKASITELGMRIRIYGAYVAPYHI